MDTLKIGSFNTKDNSINRKGGMREDGISNADILANQIKENAFDLLGTQELTIKYVNELALRLNGYKFYGSYRYGNLLTKIPFNENNNIITNKDNNGLKYNIEINVAITVILEDIMLGKDCDIICLNVSVSFV